MEFKTLQHIKKELSRLSSIYGVLVDQWNGKLVHGNDATYPQTVIIQVILGNMASDTSDCANYNHTEEVEKLYKSLDTLKSLDQYSNKCYMTHFPYTEADMIILGNVMSEGM